VIWLGSGLDDDQVDAILLTLPMVSATNAGSAAALMTSPLPSPLGRRRFSDMRMLAFGSRKPKAAFATYSTLILMRSAFSSFGRLIFSTPFSTEALTWSPLASGGSATLRENPPLRIARISFEQP